MSVFSPILARFADEAPFAVMVRGLLENVFAPAKLDALFDQHAVTQSTRELLFSTAVDLLSQVVCSVQPSVYAAYKRASKRKQITVTAKALYDKLAHVEATTSQALVQHTATEARAILAHFGNPPEPLLAGYDVRILDGNHLSGTHKKLKVLRQEARAALPGVVVAVLDPQARLIEEVVVSFDGHAQECTLVEPLLRQVSAKQLWIADRHYCTSPILFALRRRQAFFLIRQHGGHLRWQAVGRRRRVGRTARGVVYEQQVKLTDPQTEETMLVRRISIELVEPTRDGDWEVHLLSNVPAQDAKAVKLAKLYLERWSVETAFRDLTVYLGCELNTLGYPPAALLGFCLAVIKGAVRSEHGAEAEEELSSYYVSEEVSATYRGMVIAVPEPDWQPFRQASPAGLARLLTHLVRGADVGYYRKNPCRPKKPKKPPQRRPGDKHVSTHRLLNPHLYPQKKKKKTG